MKRKIRNKILISTVTVAILVFGAIISYVGIYFHTVFIEKGTNQVDSYAAQYANLVASKLNLDMGVSQSLAYSLDKLQNISTKNRIKIQQDILRNNLVKNTNYLSTWLSWELSAIDNNYKKNYGRARTVFYRKINGIELNKDTTDLNGDNVGGIYHKVKTSKKEIITQPYYYSYTQDGKNKILEASFCVPLVVDDKFVGLAGIDVTLEHFQKIISEIKPYKNSYAFLVSHGGIFVAHKNKRFINQNINKKLVKETQEHSIISKVNSGDDFSFFSEVNNQNLYFSFAPVRIGKTKMAWSIGIVVPRSEIMEEANNQLYLIIILGIIAIFIIIIVIWKISDYIAKPMVSVSNLMRKLNKKGNEKQLKSLAKKLNDETGEIAHSAYILINWINRTASFAKEIGHGNLETEYKLLGKNDKLGEALIELQNRLIKQKEADIKQKEELTHRNWINEGIAVFNNMSRYGENDFKLKSEKIIEEIVKYANVEMGALYLLNEEDPDEIYFEPMAVYAYDRKRLAEKKLRPKEGLLGRVFIEQKTIYMVNLPQDYIKITSGMGEELPACLLLIPLISENKFFGVIEIASLKKLEKYQITLLEQIAKELAIVIENIKTNFKTNTLLKISEEHSQKMIQQEEELRQNMEEMLATQEAAQKREHQLLKKIEELENKTI